MSLSDTAPVIAAPARPFLRNLERAGLYLALSVAAFLSVFPFLWMLISATNSSGEIIRGKLGFGDQFWINLDNFMNQVDLPLVMWNSAKVAVLSTVLTIAVSSLAGYGFEMFRSKMRERLYSLVLLTWMVPFAALMIPLVMMIGKAGLINTHIAILLPTIASAFIISVIGGWSQFLVPFLLITKESLTPIGVGIFQYAGTQNDSSIQLLAAACLVSVVPAIVAFLALQRLILGAMTAGAVKG